MGSRKRHVVNPGDRFGKGVLLEEIRVPHSGAPGGTQRGARMLCDCGNVYEVALGNLVSHPKPTRSCGCAARNNGVTHGLARHVGEGPHPLYSTWNNMMRRCYDSGSTSYRWYGARGIEVCKRWHSAESFVKDIELLIGFRPRGTSLERKNNEGNYEPDNVCWASPPEQARNTRGYIDGRSRESLYYVWKAALRFHPNEMCERWLEYSVFAEDVIKLGAVETGMCFTRIDSRRLYEPGNVEWITAEQKSALGAKIRWQQI